MSFLYDSIRDFICGGVEELLMREALRVNNVEVLSVVSNTNALPIKGSLYLWRHSMSCG